jgi:hypothetical protein
MPHKKKPLAAAPLRASSNPRAPQARLTENAAGYPSVREVLARPDLLRSVRRAVGIATAAGIALAGCADPVCGSSAADELRIHAGASLERLVDGEVGAAVDELAVGTGAQIHPTPTTYMTAGVMIAPSPTLPGSGGAP